MKTSNFKLGKCKHCGKQKMLHNGICGFCKLKAQIYK